MRNSRIVSTLRAGHGATAAEYIIALVLIALVALGIMKVFGGTVESKFGDANEQIGVQVDPDGEDAVAKRGDGRDPDGPGSEQRRRSEGEKLADAQRRRSDPGKEGSSIDRYRNRGADSQAGDGDDKSDGSAGRSNKTTVGDGGDGHKPTGGPAQRPDGDAQSGCQNVNPIVIIASVILVLVLFFVMGSGKRS